MLFDLRSRGRRRTVQFVYLGLAILMGGGLVLFGVGAGNGNGGLLNAFTGGGGGGNSQSQVVSQQEKTALKQTQQEPSNAGAWANLVNARWISANTAGNFNSTTGAYSASGQKKLADAITAWQRYVTLTKSPDPTLATLAARAYEQTGNYAGAASAWEIQTIAEPNALKGYECLAMNAYAAKQTRKGDLALGKVLAGVPKLSRKTLKQEITAAQASPTVAKQC